MSSGGAIIQASWATTRERGTLLMMRAGLLLTRFLARPLAAPVLHVAVLYFFLSSRRARQVSRDYLGRVARFSPHSGIAAGPRAVYRHFLAFGCAIRDKLDVWAGRLGPDVSFEDRETLRAAAASGRGALIIGSHLGNLEVCRAIAHGSGRVRLNVLVHTRNAVRFNRVLALAGASDVDLLQVTELDAAAALRLKERIDRGEWVVIAADRVPVHGGRTVDVRFLGDSAPLPAGPYVLAALLDCPVYLLFCLRRPGGYRIYFERFAERIAWRRRADRDAVIAQAAQRFAERLEHHLLLEPLQWFNFYPFWHDTAGAQDTTPRSGAGCA